MTAPSIERQEATLEARESERAAVPGCYFKPNSWAQARFFMSSAPEVIMSSAYGKGKTRVLCEKAHWLCSTYPGIQVVLARKLRAHMGNTTLHTLLDEVIHPAQRDRFWRVSADGGSTLLYPNGSRIWCVGLDNPGKARSAAFSCAYVDQAEELDEEEWNGIAGRLRSPLGPYRQLGAVCNPESTSHYLFRRYRPDLGSRTLRTEHDEVLPDGRIVASGAARAEVILSGPTDNYANLPVDYLVRLGRMSGRYRQRYVEGLWVDYKGLVYDNFKQDVHVRSRPQGWARWGGQPPPDWRRYRTVDFGFENPFVCQWWARAPSGLPFYLYREIYMTKRVVDAHATRILELEHQELETLRECAVENSESQDEVRSWARFLRSLESDHTFSDHDREDMATLDRRGVVTEPADKEVEAGIQTVHQLLTIDANGEPGIIFIRDALDELDEDLESQQRPTCTWQEFPHYHWQKHQEGKPVREEPLKLDDHGMDAQRYLFHTLKVLAELDG